MTRTAADNTVHQCDGEPTVSPWRVSAHGTVYAVKVCACGSEMSYVELEVERALEVQR
jgi:hypothetical protein